jgi:hypothetical protein
MKLFMRAKAENDFNEGSSIPRIQKMETSEIHSWVNTTIMSLGVTYDSWRHRDGSKDDFTKALEAINELWKELMSRTNG